MSDKDFIKEVEEFLEKFSEEIPRRHSPAKMFIRHLAKVLFYVFCIPCWVIDSLFITASWVSSDEYKTFIEFYKEELTNSIKKLWDEENELWQRVIMLSIIFYGISFLLFRLIINF